MSKDNEKEVQVFRGGAYEEYEITVKRKYSADREENIELPKKYTAVIIPLNDEQREWTLEQQVAAAFRMNKRTAQRLMHHEFEEEIQNHRMKLMFALSVGAFALSAVSILISAFV